MLSQIIIIVFKQEEFVELSPKWQNCPVTKYSYDNNLGKTQLKYVNYKI